MHVCSGARTASIPNTIPSPPGWSTSPTKSGPACKAQCATRSPEPVSRRATAPASASPTSARPRCSGSATKGEPLHRAIVWQDRRTSERCAELKRAGLEPLFRERTGLVLDPYFSGTKLEWLLEARQGRASSAPSAASWRSARSTATCSTASRADACTPPTSPTPAARCCSTSGASVWDDELLGHLNVPRAVLPGGALIVGGVRPHAGLRPAPGRHPDRGHRRRSARGAVRSDLLRGGRRQVHLRHRRVPAGEHRDASRSSSKHGLLTTPAWRIGDVTEYALEGSAFIAGAAVQWLRDGLGIITSADEIEGLAAQVDSAGDVVFVPALSGLGAPVLGPRRARADLRHHVVTRHGLTWRERRWRASPFRWPTWPRPWRQTWGRPLASATRRWRSQQERATHALPGGYPECSSRAAGHGRDDGAGRGISGRVGRRCVRESRSNRRSAPH